jgi:hypothetical protein
MFLSSCLSAESGVLEVIQRALLCDGMYFSHVVDNTYLSHDSAGGISNTGIFETNNHSVIEIYQYMYLARESALAAIHLQFTLSRSLMVNSGDPKP